jgi:hypothetical protein
MRSRKGFDYLFKKEKGKVICTTRRWKSSELAGAASTAVFLLCYLLCYDYKAPVTSSLQISSGVLDLGT